MAYFGAIDLGATSGRVALGEVTPDRIGFEIVHRFTHEAIKDPQGNFLWNWDSIIANITHGLELAAERRELTSISVDTWAVDYILKDPNGNITAPAYSYRDSRTDGIMDALVAELGKEYLYRNSGIQFLPFNTIYQLLAAKGRGELGDDVRMFLLPDAINHFLSGATSTEITNASTTQLLDGRTRQWDWELIDKIGLPRRIFSGLHEPQTELGVVTAIRGLEGTKVVACGSHDTASAVAATPMSNPASTIYISSGTWSLVGCERPTPIATEAALESNVTNELGVAGTVRLLKNVSGMWIISELLREWARAGESLTIEELVELAKAASTDAEIDPNDPLFIALGSMVERVQANCRARGFPVPESKGEIALCVYTSLAKNYLHAIDSLVEITGRTFTDINIVGGGSANDFLNQLTADATGLPVHAGPVEATLLGNLGVQAMAAGVITSLAELRELVRKSVEVRQFRPMPVVN